MIYIIDDVLHVLKYPFSGAIWFDVYCVNLKKQPTKIMFI